MGLMGMVSMVAAMAKQRLAAARPAAASPATGHAS
jgi:hypothetical protein